MNGYEYLFSILVLIVVSFLVIGTVGTIWDVRKLEDENEKLKDQIKTLRVRKIKGEKKNGRNNGK